MARLAVDASSVAIPPLTPLGLLPAGFHPATVAEIRAAFGSATGARRALHAQLESFVDLVRSFEGSFAAIFVAGSYVTSKETPKDLDLILMFSRPAGRADVLKHPRRNEILSRKRVRAHYRVDLFYADDPYGGIFDKAQILRPEDATRLGVPLDHKKGLLCVSLRT